MKSLKAKYQLVTFVSSIKGPVRESSMKTHFIAGARWLAPTHSCFPRDNIEGLQTDVCPHFSCCCDDNNANFVARVIIFPRNS